MTKLETRLKEDAARIEAEVTPALNSRLAAAVRRVRRTPRAEKPAGVSFPLWLAGSLSGLAGAIVVIVLMNRTDTTEQPDAAVARAVPEYVRRFDQTVPLYVETADLTGPLEEELENLRSDIEKARENVERDLDFTF
jgi:hypothetical protein